MRKPAWQPWEMADLTQFIRQTANLFAGAGIESATADAELLICNQLGTGRGELQARAMAGEDFEPSSQLLNQIELRATRVPLQHLTGAAPFRDFELAVGPGVFIPRPETESVVDLALSRIAGKTASRVLEIGTGSGAIAISIARESGATVTAVELSEEAAEYAELNISRLAPQVDLVRGDFREQNLGFGVFDLVVSNPPYIPLGAVPKDPEVRDYDPELALYGGVDGLDLIREIIELARYWLVPGGSLVLEHADGQSDAVCELLLAQWHQVSAHQDATGRYRAVSAVR